MRDPRWSPSSASVLSAAYGDLVGERSNETSATILGRVERARAIQRPD
jgi:hypothetical protein